MAYRLPIIYDIPNIYKEAKVNNQTEDWKSSMNKEMDSLHKFYLEVGTTSKEKRP